MSFQTKRPISRPVNPSLLTKKFLPVLLGIAAGYLAAADSWAESYTWYGRAHVSADFLDNGADSATNVSSNSSRLGIRGSADLTDNLKGIFQVETTIAYDNGAGSLASRDTFVGLQGSFGRVRLGQIDTPLKSIRSRVDFFGDQIGDLRNFTRLGGNAGSPYGHDFDARFKNGIYYNTPSFGGVIVNFHYSADVDTGADLSGGRTAYSSSAVYTQGDLYLAAAYELWESANDSSAIRLGASYKIGDWTLAGLFQQASIESLEPSEDVTTLGVGASYKVSDHWLVKGQVYNQNGKDREDSGATLVVVGADYIFNRQFRLLFAYAATDNDELATYRVTGGGGFGDGVTTVPGETATGLSVGLRYDF